jgi:hypothetical protein
MRILIAGILGGIAMYVWSSLAHVALPLGQMGISTMPNEAAATAALSAALGDKDGLYLFPASMTAKSGPSGLLAYHKALTQMDAKTLGSEGVVEVLQAVLAAVLLGMSGVTGFGRRVGFVTLVGVIAAIATNPSYWIWYKFPTDYTAAYMLIQLVEYLVAGVVIAAVLGRKSQNA